MRIVLVKDYKIKGRIRKAGDIIEVADGFARNFLIPNGIAVRATEGNIKKVMNEIEMKKRKEEKLIENAKKLKERIEKVSLVFHKPAGEGGRLHGTVTNAELAEALAKEGILVKKEDIIIEEDVRLLGNYIAKVKLYGNIEANLRFSVEPLK